MIAVSDSTPGPSGVNMATYAGFKAYGILGGIASSLALVAPSLIIILIIARILQKFRDSLLVNDLFYGLRAAAFGLSAVSVLNVLLQNLTFAGAQSILAYFNYKKIILFALLVFGVFKFKRHPLLYIGIGAAAGILFKL